MSDTLTACKDCKHLIMPPKILPNPPRFKAPPGAPPQIAQQIVKQQAAQWEQQQRTPECGATFSGVYNCYEGKWLHKEPDRKPPITAVNNRGECKHFQLKIEVEGGDSQYGDISDNK